MRIVTMSARRVAKALRGTDTFRPIPGMVVDRIVIPILNDKMRAYEARAISVKAMWKHSRGLTIQFRALDPLGRKVYVRAFSEDTLRVEYVPEPVREELPPPPPSIAGSKPKGFDLWRYYETLAPARPTGLAGRYS